MISGDERQRAADELREASTGAYRLVDALDVIAGAAGIETEGKFSHEVEVETYAAIADLIDPTCKLRFDSVHQDFVCTQCGAWFDGFQTYDGHGKWNDMRFCPHCGARVVSGRE